MALVRYVVWFDPATEPLELAPQSATSKPRRILRRALTVVFVVNATISGSWMAFTYVIPSPARAELSSDKALYVGAWESVPLSLHISQDGMVEYSSTSTYGGTHYGGKILRFDRDDFLIAVFPCVPARFRVSSRPHLEGTRWAMTVDGVTLHRGPSGAGSASTHEPGP